MPCNHQDYIHYLDTLDCTMQEKCELLNFLYQFCDEFTDIGLGIHSVQHVLNLSDTITGEEEHGMVPSLCAEANAAFHACKSRALH